MRFKKYYTVFKLNIQNSLAYRIDFFMNLLSGVIPLLVQIFIWTNIFKYNKNELIMGYSLSSMLSYILVAIAISKLIQSYTHFTISNEIKSGMLNQYLSKPLDHYCYWISSEIGGKFFYNIVLYLAFAMLNFLFLANKFNIIFLGLGLLALLQAFIINFLINYLLALLAFWLQEVSQIFTSFGLISIFASGGVIPIDFFPQHIQRILGYLPFELIIFFPVKLFTDQVSLDYALQNIGLQTLWILLLSLTGKYTWKKGIKVYSAFGG